MRATRLQRAHAIDNEHHVRVRLSCKLDAITSIRHNRYLSVLVDTFSILVDTVIKSRINNNNNNICKIQ